MKKVLVGGCFLGNNTANKLAKNIGSTVERLVSEELSANQMCDSMGITTMPSDEIRNLISLGDCVHKLWLALEARYQVAKRRRRPHRGDLAVLAELDARILARLNALDVTRMPFPDTVDYTKHEIVGVLHSDRQGDTGRIGEVAAHGYETTDGRVVRPMRVLVLKHVLHCSNRK